MKKAENSKSLIVGLPGIVLQVGGLGLGEQNYFLLGTVLLVWGCWYYVKAKGRAGEWALLGVLSVIGFIILACLSDECSEAPDDAPPADEHGSLAWHETKRINQRLDAIESQLKELTDATPPGDE